MYKLRHPNVNGFFGVVIESSPLMLIMELAECSLFDLLYNMKDDEIIISSRYHIIAGITSGINYIHNQNIMHRDLKSHNILVKYLNNFHRDNFKLTDFGSAFNSDANSQSLMGTRSSNKGTLAWMASEQLFSDDFKYCKNTDIYSLGIVFYEILNRQIPFSKDGKMLSEAQIYKTLSSGIRPYDYQPLLNENQFDNKVITLMKSCCHTQPNLRPKAQEAQEVMNTVCNNYPLNMENNSNDNNHVVNERILQLEAQLKAKENEAKLRQQKEVDDTLRRERELEEYKAKLEAEYATKSPSSDLSPQKEQHHQTGKELIFLMVMVIIMMEICKLLLVMRPSLKTERKLQVQELSEQNFHGMMILILMAHVSEELLLMA